MKVSRRNTNPQKRHGNTIAKGSKKKKQKKLGMKKTALFVA